ncbi:hypothetical protein O6H91_20G044900 [Diphasiastrum complanatum]|nr:hypothetical protein O6H91_20G044900 [Diphasiastrum complanatum]
MADNDPWPVLQSWQARKTNPNHYLSPPISRTCCSDAFEDLSYSSSFLEPTSVLDHLSSPSLDSMHSPLSFTEQQFHDIEQCLQEDVCLTDHPATDDFATDFANSIENRAADCRIFEENGDLLYCKSAEMAGIRSPPASTYYLEDPRAMKFGEKIMVDQSDSSSEWIDCLMNEAGEVGIASCFERNPCESTQSSPEESWRDDFAFACSSESISPSAWTQQVCPADLPSASWSNHLLSSSNLASLALQHQQPHYPSHLLALPNLWPPQDRRDAFGMLSSIGLLGANLERKGGDRGLRILQLLIDCVKYLDTITMAGSLTASERRISPDCTNTLKKLTELSTAYGDPLQRVTTHFTNAIAAGVENNRPSTSATAGSPSRDESLEDKVMAFRTLNEAVPYIKFAHLTANQAILEAAEAAEKVHIIDCGIVQGVQWAALLQAFATRPAGAIPPKIRITGIASPSLGKDPCTSLAATGKRLTEFANLLNLELEFCPVYTKLEDLDPSMLRLDADEVLAINFMFQLHHLLDDSRHRLQRALKLVQLLSPAVITVAEYDTSINAPSLQTRFLNAFCFYAAIFDSLDTTSMSREDPERIKIERLFFAKDIKNMMVVEGAERKERRESNENWKRWMELAGFKSKPALSHYATTQARLLLRPSYCDNFTLMERPGCLSLGWLDHPIVTVSAWHC